MSVSSRTIAKNTGVLMVSQLITWGVAFLLTIFLPRYLGPQGLGQIQLANSLWVILGVIAALGTDLLITKEIAKSPGQLNELAGTTLVLRTLIFIFGALGIGAYVLVAGYQAQTVTVIWIVGISALIAQLSGTYDAVSKGLERMEYTSLAGVVSKVLQAVLIIALLLLGFGVIPIAVVGILANITVLAILYYFLWKRYAMRFSINWQLIIPVLKASLPFFLVTVGITLYHQVDTVIISLLADEKTIGWYGAANRLYGTLLFVPNVFMTALYPALSRAQTDSINFSRRLVEKSLNLLVLVSVPVGWGISVIANPLAVLLFGTSFANSGPVLAVRGCFLVLTFVNMLLGFLLISMDRQKVWGYVILIATFATIPLDLVLIPWTMKTFANGALGGALSFTFTEIGQTIAALALLPRGYLSWANAKAVSRMLLAGLVMVGVTWIFRDAFIVIPIIIGGVTYFGMVMLLHALPKEDWIFMLDTVRSIFQRLRGRFSKTAELKG